MKLVSVIVLILGTLSGVSHSIAGVNVISTAATPSGFAAGSASALGQNVAATTTSSVTGNTAFSSASAVASGGKKHHKAPPPTKKHHPVPPPTKKHYPVPPPTKKHHPVPPPTKKTYTVVPPPKVYIPKFPTIHKNVGGVAIASANARAAAFGG